MRSQTISATEAKKIDLVAWLKTLGHSPQKIRNNDHWYLSPFRQEKTPSFKVNQQLNVWFDHGIGEGGNPIDFGIRYFNCSVAELLQRLSNDQSLCFSFHPHPAIQAGEKKNAARETGRIKVISIQQISDPGLRQYLSSRKIPDDIANQFCKEVSFELYDKKHVAIGFQNDQDGYELRNAYFKGSSSPKSSTQLVRSEAENLLVFEGFFSFLSFQTLQAKPPQNFIDLPKHQSNFLVLNSLSFFEKNREAMEKYAAIHLCLDHDDAGKKATAKALQWSDKYKDLSRLYSQHKDLNEYLLSTPSHELKQSQRQGRHL